MRAKDLGTDVDQRLDGRRGRLGRHALLADEAHEILCVAPRTERLAALRETVPMRLESAEVREEREGQRQVREQVVRERERLDARKKVRDVDRKVC